MPTNPPIIPIVTLPLFAGLDRLPLELLRNLSPADWQRPTLARDWTVHDVAAHLLDGNLRTLSLLRDGHFAEAPMDDTSYAGLVAYLTRLNADRVRAARRLSPAVLIALLAQSGAEYTAYLHTLGPWAPAAFAVAWANETESLSWFHLAREHTEKWHHQQQIRTAVGQPQALMVPPLFQPFLATVMRGLPHCLPCRGCAGGHAGAGGGAPAAGSVWEVARAAKGWLLQPPRPARPAARVTLAPADAWQLFTKDLGAAEAQERAQITGDKALATAALRLVAVMG